MVDWEARCKDAEAKIAALKELLEKEKRDTRALCEKLTNAEADCAKFRELEKKWVDENLKYRDEAMNAQRQLTDYANQIIKLKAKLYDLIAED